MITAKEIKMTAGTNTAAMALQIMTTQWLAEMCRIEAVKPDGTRIPIPRNKAVIRDDLLTPEAVLGVVGLVYEPIQNPAAFAFFDILTQQYNGTYQKGYIIDNGRQIIIIAKIGDDYEVRPGDVISDHITLMNSFDGSSPFKAFFTPIRKLSGAHCRATFGGAVNSVAIRHTITASTRMSDAMTVLNVSATFFEQFKNLSKQMAGKALTRKLIDEFLLNVFGEVKTKPNKEKLETIANLIVNGTGNTGKSLWDAYNGVIEWADFYRYAGKKNADILNAGSAVLTGVGIKEKAFRTAVSML